MTWHHAPIKIAFILSAMAGSACLGVAFKRNDDRFGWAGTGCALLSVICVLALIGG
jgi:hypothetical protein